VRLTFAPEIERIAIEYIIIRNIKCFEDARINFNSAGTPLILGANARGKSLILQLLGIGLNGLRSVPFSYNWKKVVKTGKKTGAFEIAFRLYFTPERPRQTLTY
jgi:predicted ATP-dependent endonuclease of OLD family